MLIVLGTVYVWWCCVSVTGLRQGDRVLDDLEVRRDCQLQQTYWPAFFSRTRLMTQSTLQCWKKNERKNKSCKDIPILPRKGTQTVSIGNKPLWQYLQCHSEVFPVEVLFVSHAIFCVCWSVEWFGLRLHIHHTRLEDLGKSLPTDVPAPYSIDAASGTGSASLTLQNLISHCQKYQGQGKIPAVLDSHPISLLCYATCVTRVHLIISLWYLFEMTPEKTSKERFHCNLNRITEA